MKSGPRGELTVKITGSKMGSWTNKYPHPSAFSEFAPEFGMDFKEYMRDAWRRIGRLQVYLEVLPWSWRVRPDGTRERVSYDEAKINATVKEALEMNYAIYEQMEMKPVKVGKPSGGEAKNMGPGHCIWHCAGGVQPGELGLHLRFRLSRYRQPDHCQRGCGAEENFWSGYDTALRSLRLCLETDPGQPFLAGKFDQGLRLGQVQSFRSLCPVRAESGTIDGWNHFIEGIAFHLKTGSNV